MTDSKKVTDFSEPAAVPESVFDRLEKLLTFPTVFPLKVMGNRVDDFAQQLCACVLSHIPDFDPKSIEMRASSKGTYLSLTMMVPLKSRADLEAVYTAVSTHPLVKVVL